MKAISLFSGAGGMDVGFKNAGFNVIAANEMDKHACDTFRANHPECNLIEGDIDSCGEAFIGLKGIDVVFGGPPCQGFSVAGKMDPDDPRSKLIFSFCNVVEKIKPKAFVMENVKALGSLSKFEDVRTELLSRFQKAGYVVTIHILNSKDFFEELTNMEPDIKEVIKKAVDNRVPISSLYTAYNYFTSMTTERLGANLIQAQRDYFGAHTYQRVDAPTDQYFHSNWKNL